MEENFSPDLTDLANCLLPSLYIETLSKNDMKQRFLALILCLMAVSSWGFAQTVGVKSNLLYWGTGTPNLGLEVRVAPHWTIDVSGGWNPFTMNKETGLKWRHWAVAPEARYYLCEAFNGHFFGLHGVVGFYNVNKLNIPIGWLKEIKDYRLQGWAYGGGLTYGYEWVLAKHWNLEASLSAGYIYSDYTKYNCEHCGKVVAEETKHYLGPTKATLSLIYLF